MYMIMKIFKYYLPMQELMPERRSKEYSRGDQIHFIVTEDFVDTANQFADFCKSNSMNTSEAMRNAIFEWLRVKMMKERKLEQLIQGTSSLQSIADEYERSVLKEI